MKEDKTLKIFFDSNIIIDALSGRKESSFSLELVKMVFAGTIKGYLATKQITDIYYVLRRYQFTEKERVELLKVIVKYFVLIPTLSSDIKYSLNKIKEGDFEDYLLDNICKVSCCDYLVTSNISDFEYSRNNIITPKDLVTILNINE